MKWNFVILVNYFIVQIVLLVIVRKQFARLVNGLANIAGTANLYYKKIKFPNAVTDFSF